MGDVFFYHLTRRDAAQTLALLLGKALGAGWRVQVRGKSDQMMEQLDHALWAWPQDGFLPHAIAGTQTADHSPVVLSTGAETAGFQCVMTVEGAEITPQDISQLNRVCVLFDGHNDGAVQTARQQWKTLTDQGCSAQYWSEESGQWQMKAQKN